MWRQLLSDVCKHNHDNLVKELALFGVQNTG